jgi:hypothetical protein
MVKGAAPVVSDGGSDMNGLFTRFVWDERAYNHSTVIWVTYEIPTHRYGA